MRMGRKPEIGDTMFHVCEHLYYVPERAAPLSEYCVCEATVVGFLKGGYTEVKLVGKNSQSSWSASAPARPSPRWRRAVRTVLPAALLLPGGGR